MKAGIFMKPALATVLGTLLLLQPAFGAEPEAGGGLEIRCIDVQYERNAFSKIGDAINDIPVLNIFIKGSKAKREIGEKEKRPFLTGVVQEMVSDHLDWGVEVSGGCGAAKRGQGELILHTDLRHFQTLSESEHAAVKEKEAALERYKAAYKGEGETHKHDEVRGRISQLVRVRTFLQVRGTKERYLLSQADGRLEQVIGVIEIASEEAGELLSYAFSPFQGETLAEALRRLEGNADGHLDQIRDVLAAGLDGELDEFEAAARARVFFQLLDNNPRGLNDEQEIRRQHYFASLQVLYGDLQAAMEAFEPVAKKIPVAPSFYMLVGERYGALQDWGHAMEAYAMAANFAPDEPSVLLRVADANYEMLLADLGDPSAAFEKAESAYLRFLDQDVCNAALHWQLLERMETRLATAVAADNTARYYARCDDIDAFAAGSIDAAVRIGMFAADNGKPNAADSIYRNTRRAALELPAGRYREQIIAFIDYNLAYLFHDPAWPEGYDLSEAAAAYKRVLARHLKGGAASEWDQAAVCPQPIDEVFHAYTVTSSFLNLIEVEAVTGDLEAARRHLDQFSLFLYPPANQPECADAGVQRESRGVADSSFFLLVLVDALSGADDSNMRGYVLRFAHQIQDMSPVWDYELALRELSRSRAQTCSQKGGGCDRLNKALSVTRCAQAIDKVAIQFNLSKNFQTAKPPLPAECSAFSDYSR